MAINLFESSTSFIDSAAGKPTFVAASDLNRLRQNALFLDMLTLRGRSAWTDTLIPSENYGGSPFALTACSFQYRVGLTTATFQIYSLIPGGTHTARVRFNGTQVATAGLTGGVGGGFQNINVTISGMGFTDYQIIDVEVDVTVSGSSTPATYRMVDAYVSPLVGVYTPTYPGVPTWGAVNASNLNLLASAQQWCMDRLLISCEPALMSNMIHSGHGYVSDKLLWTGSATRTNSASRLQLEIGLEVVANQSEYLQVTVGDTSFGAPIIATSSAFAAFPSQQLYLFDIDVSARTDGVPFPIELRQFVTTAGNPQRETRFTIYAIETRRASAPSVTIPALMQPRESLTYSALQTRLTQIGTVTANAAARISAAPDCFNRQRMFRWCPGLDAGQRITFKDTLIATKHRRTDAVWVRGKNVKIGYGNRRIIRNTGGPWTQEYQYTHDIISGDVVQDKLVYLDTFEGLFPGVDMWFFGDDVRYVAESWG